MIRITRWPIAVCLALALDPAATQSATASRDTASALGALPARFTGLLPCADCAGIRYQIDLLPGGAYVQRMTYLRSDRDESFYQLGRWSLSADRRTLSLEGGREATARWRVVDSHRLQKLDADGRPIQSVHAYVLARTSGAAPIEPRLELSGMFTYLADAARFKECRTGLEWPVAMSDDYRSLERAYAAQRAAPGAPLRVSLRGRVEQRPRTEGTGTEPTLVVEAFLGGVHLPRRSREHALAPDPPRRSGRSGGSGPAGALDGARVTLEAGHRLRGLQPLQRRIQGGGGHAALRADGVDQGLL